MNELVDRRILGAFKCIDGVSGNSVNGSLVITSSPGWVIKPNQSGVYLIFDGSGFHALTGDFYGETSPWPSPLKVPISIQDPTLQYLPRLAVVNAPSAVPPALQSVTLYPSPAAPTAFNWAVVRASVVRQTSPPPSPQTPPQGLPWAVLQIVQTTAGSTTSTTIATGMSDTNGEALLAAIIKTPVPGAPAVTQTIQVWFDPSTLTQPATWIPNPDEILSNPNLKPVTQTVQLAVGQVVTASIPISV